MLIGDGSQVVDSILDGLIACSLSQGIHNTSNDEFFDSSISENTLNGRAKALEAFLWDLILSHLEELRNLFVSLVITLFAFLLGPCLSQP